MMCTGCEVGHVVIFMALGAMTIFVIREMRWRHKFTAAMLAATTENHKALEELSGRIRGCPGNGGDK